MLFKPTSFALWGCFIVLTMSVQPDLPAEVPGAAAIEQRINGYLQLGESLLQEGDIVVRMNQDPFSQFIRCFNKKDKKFSHAGLVLNDDGKLMIYHMASEDGNPEKVMLRQSLAVFGDPRHNYGYAIYRYKFTRTELDRMRQLVKHWYLQPVHFDTAFNLATDNELYCSEMVQKAIMLSTRERIRISATSLSALEAAALGTYYKLPAQPGRKIIAIDDLYSNVDCVNIAEFRY